jgi:hypothetical protein
MHSNKEKAHVLQRILSGRRICDEEKCEELWTHRNNNMLLRVVRRYATSSSFSPCSFSPTASLISD